MQADVVVIGGGHAGCEAALAAARMGMRTILVTHDRERLAQMSCNPAIGGPGKSHIVREIDVLGGMMARAADRVALQYRLLNRSKGPAVWSLRVQCPISGYCAAARDFVARQERLLVVEGDAMDLVAEGPVISGIRLASGTELAATAVVVTTGTFLGGRCFIGLRSFSAGRWEEPPSVGLTAALVRFGLQVGRLKTGTPPRLARQSIDWERFAEQPSEPEAGRFSYFTGPLPEHQRQYCCHVGYTTEHTHEIIRAGLDRSPLYAGMIRGVGPRYCPSIEDKVVRFPDRSRHQLFLEPVERDGDMIYPNGISTSLPEDVQLAFVRSIPGLERAELMRPGYAVEYDFVQPTQLRMDLGTRAIRGLYLAGQINGTTGYEEAAGQGLWAGINAARYCQGAPAYVPDRSRCYLAVMIDDLVTRGCDEPYRMFTSRAEHRLALRFDNAHVRLLDDAQHLGVLADADRALLEAQRERLARERDHLGKRVHPREAINARLVVAGSAPLHAASSLDELLARPELTYMDVRDIERIASGVDAGAASSGGGEGAGGDDRPEVSIAPGSIGFQVQMEVKYRGYINRQEEEIARFRRLEARQIPGSFDYGRVTGLSIESRQKLAAVRPLSLGQASRIPGVTPAAIALLSVFLKAQPRDPRR
ncbi:MAG: tRNA uridine-5-carboxymethylaminomethyl(34) synthesis enzyme MnmG [Candidatus Schekmanbacteria bacterium]|nr:tRNA uridine-5-carboxymethylaminomethyl(34) synthesis enzyme MnmG [Candidatus Schekmanbacteria bacterium]